MKIKTRKDCSGIALVIVMVSILVLSSLAGIFAYSMKIEMRLARNVMNQTQMEWAARGCVERAKWILGLQLNVPNEPYDALHQRWAGGPGGPGTSNSPLATVSLEEPFQFEGGEARITAIVDQERKFNINVADDLILQRALINVMGMDPQDASTVSDSILDWRDADNMTRMSGWEEAEYLSLPQPYAAKNGPLDDLPEMLSIHGIREHPAVYNGGADDLPPSIFYRESPVGRAERGQSYPVGLKDLFCVVGNPRFNAFTASAEVLQLAGLPPDIASAIVTTRTMGAQDGAPFMNLGELIANVPGGSREVLTVLNQYATVRSSTFKVEVEVVLNQYTRKYVALLRRNTAQDIQILSAHWE